MTNFSVHFFPVLQKFMLLSCIVVLLGTSPSLSSRSEQPKLHRVQPGETLLNLADMYGYSPFEIASANNLNPAHTLMVGQQIIIPDRASSNSLHTGTDILPEPRAVPPRHERVTEKKQTSLAGVPYAFYGSGEPVPSALKSFAANYGMPVIISSEVSGTINGKIGPFPPVRFLDELARLNHLLWYFDGDTLYVYDGQEIDKAILSLDHLSTQSLKKTLVDMGLWDSRYGWRERPYENLIYLSGPPRYIEVVTQTATILDQKAGERAKSQMDFQVFPLKYAWAEDHTISYRNQEITIPGVATLLKQIVLQNNTGITPREDTPTRANSLVPATPITGKQPPALASQNPAIPDASDNQPGNRTQASENVLINADRRSNSIIIHDLASRMPMYGNLIKTLDKPLSQIEINVSIIDVDTSSIDELGVNWKLDNPSGKSFFTFDPSSSLSSGPASTILKVTAGRLLAQVRMLATKNKAKILSRPSVLTLDNMEAVLDNNQTFYVKVQGGDANSNTAQLYPITSGSVLKVTPRIIEERNHRKIHLDVNIQDGTSEATSTLGSDVTLPIVKNTTISTQAMIDENESLLVGGYFYEKKSTKVEKVPFLGDIPVMGQLFRQNSDQYTKNVRLFLITPKVVSL